MHQVSHFVSLMVSCQSILTNSPFAEIPKKLFRCTPLDAKVVIYHCVDNFMLKAIDNVVSMPTCAEIL